MLLADKNDPSRQYSSRQQGIAYNSQGIECGNGINISRLRLAIKGTIINHAAGYRYTGCVFVSY